VVDGERISKFSTYSGRGSIRGWLRTVIWHSLVDLHRAGHDEVSLDELERAFRETEMEMPAVVEKPKPDVAPSTLDLQRAAAGSFSGPGANLSIDGIWQLTVTVTSAAGTVEVPLLAATTVPAQPVQTVVSPGLPTIYTSQLGAAGSAQVYLDPGGPGQNELHVTFFDPAGAELQTESTTIALFPATGDAVLPPSRMLEPGHFVATIDAVAGDRLGLVPADLERAETAVTGEQRLE